MKAPVWWKGEVVGLRQESGGCGSGRKGKGEKKREEKVGKEWEEREGWRGRSLTPIGRHVD